jgi:hypothetical protein
MKINEPQINNLMESEPIINQIIELEVNTNLQQRKDRNQ